MKRNQLLGRLGAGALTAVLALGQGGFLSYAQPVRGGDCPKTSFVVE